MKRFVRLLPIATEAAVIDQKRKTAAAAEGARPARGDF